MASTNKNMNEGSKSSTGGKRYTTRKVMELTEKRRKQMEEEARRLKSLEEPASGSAAETVTPSVADQPRGQSFVREFEEPGAGKNGSKEPAFPVRQNNASEVPSVPAEEKKVSSDFLEAIKNFTDQIAASAVKRDSIFAREYIKPEQKSDQSAVSDSPSADKTPAPHLIPDVTVQKSDARAAGEAASKISQNKTDEAVQPSVADGKSVASFFRDAPGNPTEQIVSQLIEREFNKASQEILSIDEANRRFTPKLQAPVATPQEIDDAAVLRENKILKAVRAKKIADIWFRVLNGLFTVSAFALFVMMLTPLLIEGWSRHYYEQTPFVLILALSMAWRNRRYLQRRAEWFLGSAVIVAGGMGVYLAAAQDAHVYIQLAGFLIACLGLFMWRYEEEGACRMIFPLTCLFFMFAPPALLEWAATSHLNEAVFRLSAWILNSFHIPAIFDDVNFHVGVGSIDTAGDPTAFRSIFAAMVLGAVCVSFQNMRTFWSILLFSSVILWGIFGNVVRITVTGMMLHNFGLEYTSAFFVDYSVAVVMLFTIAGLTLTAGLLPHKEE